MASEMVDIHENDHRQLTDEEYHRDGADQDRVFRLHGGYTDLLKWRGIV